MKTLRVTPILKRRYRGRRARRAAFYSAARIARFVERLVNLPAVQAEHERLMRNVMIYGTSHPEARLP